MIADEIKEICELQTAFSAENTPAMQARGELIRTKIRGRLEAQRVAIEHALSLEYPAEISFEGRDGTGRKTRIPWHRIYVKDLSPSAQEGWYVVYLFKADGSGAYLCLSHGSTKFDGMSFNPRPDQEMADLVSFARSSLSSATEGDERLIQQIDLAHSGPLGTAYPKSTAFAYFYPASLVPSNEELASDLLRFVGWLGRLYAMVELGRTPTSQSPERNALEAAISPLASRGQGRGLTGPERKAVELHAMRLASAHLRDLGFSVSDVSGKQSFDIEAKRDSHTVCVEVKGTTGGPGSILMTANEVDLHRNKHPNNALIIVHGIDLVRGKNPKAKAGVLECAMPWRLHEEALKPTAYEIRSPLSGQEE